MEVVTYKCVSRHIQQTSTEVMSLLHFAHRLVGKICITVHV